MFLCCLDVRLSAHVALDYEQFFLGRQAESLDVRYCPFWGHALQQSADCPVLAVQSAVTAFRLSASLWAVWGGLCFWAAWRSLVHFGVA